jgi:hypothetical protein
VIWFAAFRVRSLYEMTTCLLQVVKRNDPDLRAVMELTHDRKTDVVAGFSGKYSDNR